MRYQLVQLIPSGDVYVIEPNTNQACGPLHHTEWQTDGELDTAKIEAGAWNFDENFVLNNVTVIHEFN